MYSRRSICCVRWAVLGVLAVGIPSAARGNPWTRPAGDYYLQLTYAAITTRQEHDAEFRYRDIAKRYTQHTLDFLGELGVIDRWLTLATEMTLLRQSRYGPDRFTGFGDVRVAFWSGLVVRPVRFSVGVTLGLPTGEPDPRAELGASAERAQTLARLPTGDGELDVEFALGLGYSFGGTARYRVRHFLRVQASYWLRTTPRAVSVGEPRDLSDAIRYGVSFGARFPGAVIRRFWFVLHVFGTEYFSRRGLEGHHSGLGEGTTLTGVGFDIIANVYRGLSVFTGFGGAPRARLLPTGPHLRLGLSYQPIQ